MSREKIRVAYFGNYDPLYTRVRTVLKGLRLNNVEVIECRSNQRNRLFRLAILAYAYFKINKNVDLILVSEGGQAYVPLAKIISVFTRKPLLFDAFISYYHVKVIDTKSVKPNSLKGFYFYYLDKISCLLADRIILDTKEHVQYFCKEFGLPYNKFKVLPVGSDDEMFYPQKNGAHKRTGNFLVFLVTSFYPVHGVEHVVQAAKILENHSDIKFLVVGDGLTKPNIIKLAGKLEVRNVEFKGIVPPYFLPDLMSQSDVCLGQFGGTDHGDMVVPAKVYDSMAMSKPIITGRGRAVQANFENGKHLVMCPFADAKSLANAILALKENDMAREEMARGGYNFFKEKFDLRAVGLVARDILEEELSGRPTSV